MPCGSIVFMFGGKAVFCVLGDDQLSKAQVLFGSTGRDARHCACMSEGCVAKVCGLFLTQLCPKPWLLNCFQLLFNTDQHLIQMKSAGTLLPLYKHLHTQSLHGIFDFCFHVILRYSPYFGILNHSPKP